LLLLPLLTLAPPLVSPDGLDDEDGMVGGLLLTEPRV